MQLTIVREHRPIKAGWAAHSSATRLTAHGRTEALADANLERTIRLLLAPFQRAGTLDQAIREMGIAHAGTGADLDIVLVDADG